MYENWHKLIELMNEKHLLDDPVFRHIFDSALNEWYDAGHADGVELMCGCILRPSLIASGKEL